MRCDAVLFHRTYGPWRYLSAPRYLTDNSVRQVKFWPAQDLVFAACGEGLTVFSWRRWTLRDKAAFYEAQMRPKHEKYGLTRGCDYKVFGDPRGCVQGPGDNGMAHEVAVRLSAAPHSLTVVSSPMRAADGLWSSMYLGSQLFRFAATGSAEAKENAWRTFAALELLHNVTGIKGLVGTTPRLDFLVAVVQPIVVHIQIARTVTPRGPINPGRIYGGRWYNSTSMPQWTWKGDASSDEVPLTSYFVATHILLR